MKDRQTVDVYELCGVAKPAPKFVKAGTDPDGPSGMATPPQEFAGRPDAYVDQDTD